MCERNRHWHELFRLITSESEHHTLISCTGHGIIVSFFSFLNFKGFVYTHSDVRRLLLDTYKNCTSVTVKANFTAIISYTFNNTSNNSLYIYSASGRNLTKYDYKPRLGCCLACYMSMRVFGKYGVKNRIRYLIANFIRMTFCNRF